jgi:hypothetical protein
MSSPFRRPAPRGRAALLIAAAVALGWAGPAQAQKPDDVSIITADGVELRGSYYPSAKGKNAPVAILLHKFGSDHTKGDWDKLATKLQSSERGFAVLTFDFRGHGGSTTVSTDFWKQPYNMAQINKSSTLSKKTVISYKDFKTTYFPYLVNDIAAARHYIDQRNDASDCNSANIFLIGAQESAALGVLWLAHEWQRQAAPAALGGKVPKGGEDIAGAIWLSASSKGPKNHTLPYTSILARSPEVRDKVPMCFFYGEGDTTGASDANYLFTTVLKAGQAVGGVKVESDYKVAIKGTNLAGIDLLKTPKAEELLNENIEKVMGKRGAGAVWTERKVNQMRFDPVLLSWFGIQG